MGVAHPYFYTAPPGLALEYLPLTQVYTFFWGRLYKGAPMKVFTSGVIILMIETSRPLSVVFYHLQNHISLDDFFSQAYHLDVLLDHLDFLCNERSSADSLSGKGVY